MGPYKLNRLIYNISLNYNNNPIITTMTGTITTLVTITILVTTAIVIIKGVDKVKVGHVAAKIRKVYPAEPYKGKGVRYAGEVVRRKAGKTVTK